MVDQMKYLTMDWWVGRCAMEPLERYWAYIDSIRSKLPVDVVHLLEDVNLHDAKLRSLAVDVAGKSLIGHLDAYKYTSAGIEEGRRRVQLTYLVLRRVTSTADPEVGLGGPHGYGDLGYDEIELLADGSFAHRMLFSSGIELAVEFEQFRLEVEDLK
jgi:hypothetical protein